MKLDAPVYVLHWRVLSAHKTPPEDRYGWLSLTHIRFGSVEVFSRGQPKDGIYPGVTLKNYSGRYLEMYVVPRHNGHKLANDIVQSGIHGNKLAVERLTLTHTIAYSYHMPYATSVVVDATNVYNVMLVEPGVLGNALDRVLTEIGVDTADISLARRELVRIMGRG